MDDDEFATTPALKKVFIHINKQYRLPICQLCNCGLSPEGISSHLLRNHAIRISDSEISDETHALHIILAKSNDPCLSEYAKLKQNHIPIAGIKIEGGFQCKKCLHCNLSEQKMRSHAKLLGCGRDNFVLCMIQRISGGSKYFAVTTSTQKKRSSPTKADSQEKQSQKQRKAEIEEPEVATSAQIDELKNEIQKIAQLNQHLLERIEKLEAEHREMRSEPNVIDDNATVVVDIAPFFLQSSESK